MSTTTEYVVTGMTCAHCVQAVTEEVTALSGVTDVAVDLASGGLTVVSENVLQDSIVATGMLIAFYYGVTAFSCAWQFRRQWHSARDVLMKLVLPLAGGVSMLVVLVLAGVSYADPEYGETVFFGVGGVFVVETLSVVIQVFWYKRTGRRVFLMAPLHHHFEKKGWAEPTIVIRFWIISMILALVGLSTLKIR